MALSLGAVFKSYAATVAIVYAIVYGMVVVITSIVSAIQVRIERKERTVRSATEFTEIKKTQTEEDNTEEQKTMTTEQSHLIEIDTDSVQTQTQKKDAIYDKNALKHWAKLVYSKKKVYWAMIPHIFDQATDFGVLMQYYALYTEQDTIGSMSTKYLFWCSISILVSHKIISTLTVFSLTKKWSDALLQFADILIMKAIYVSYKMGATEPTNMQRYLGILEAVFESSPQIMLSMVYLLKSKESNTDIPIIIIVSLLFSLWSIASRVISDDKLLFEKAWNGLQFSYKQCPIMNWRYLLRAFWRFLEITNRIILLSLLWTLIGGFGLSWIIACETLYLLWLCFQTKTPDPLGMLVYLTYVYGENGDKTEKFVKGFWAYRVISFYVFMTLVTVFAAVGFETVKVEEYEVRNENTKNIGLGLLCYTWITGPIWMFVGLYSYTEGAGNNRSITRDILRLIEDKNYSDALELLAFGIKLSIDDALRIARDILTDIDNEIFIKINKYLCEQYPNVWNCQDNYNERTPIMMKLYRYGINKSNISNVEYVINNYKYDWTLKDSEGRTLKELIMTHTRDDGIKKQLLNGFWAYNE